jgi:hypothetical protein
LKFVVVRNVGDRDHRIVNSVADIAFARSGLADVDSDERHDGVLFGVGTLKLTLDSGMHQSHYADS